MAEHSDSGEQGVLFPREQDGRRSTAATGRAVWADAARPVDAGLAARIEAAGDWRQDYVGAVVAHTAAATRTAEGALAVARAGLASLAGRMVFERDGASAATADALRGGRPLTTTTVAGGGEPERELVIPYRGTQLRGDALRRQLDTWVTGGTIESSCAAAVSAVLDQPEMLRLSDRAFALLGAGAEMGPLEPLSRWGAHVVAVDRPSSRVWDRLRQIGAAGAGTLTVLEGEPGVAGVDLLTRTPEVMATLLTAADGLPLTVGSYAYVDGARHVQVVHASDTVIERLLTERPDTGYAELATPTDAFAVPAEVVAEARERWRRRGWRSAAQVLPRALSRGALYAAAYASDVVRADGGRVGIADVLVPQQGPNYALAKRVQRWRAQVAQADGLAVSANVAPPTGTRSVTRNRVLAAAYAGAGRFGVEIFDPRTTRVLMAALLVHDVRVATPAPSPSLSHPDDLFVAQAAHGGLWRSAYTPRSVLGLAAVTGMPKALLRR